MPLFLISFINALGVVLYITLRARTEALLALSLSPAQFGERVER